MEKPVEKPVENPVVNHVPINITNPFIEDVWDVSYRIQMHNLQLQTKLIETIKEELKFPPFLRGKSESERKYQIEYNINIIVGNILKNIKSNENQYKITGMIIENLSIYEKLALTHSSSEKKMFELVKEACKVLSNELEGDISSISNNSVVDICIEEINEKEKEKVSDNKEKPKIYKFSKEEVIDYKRSLYEAQEKFFATCIPKKIMDEKNNIINIIDISDDVIQFGKYKFSKNHYMNNQYFQKRLISKYKNTFNVKNVQIEKDDKLLFKIIYTD